MKQRRKALALAFACALTAFQTQAADAVMDQAYKHMQANNPKAAYALLEPEESARAGDKDFDFLFALAALDVGQNTRAIFALERVLAVEPTNARARAELARAYLAVGEAPAARAELNTVREQNVPDEVVKSIDNILDAVDRLDSENKTIVRGYVEGSIGYDTNVNASTTQGTVSVPALGGLPITLDPTSTAREDWFASIGGGVSFRSPFNKEWALVGGASGTQRLNFHADDLDQLNTDFNLGVINNRGKHVFSLMAQAGTLRLENDRYRDVYGATGQWQYNIDARNQVSAYIQYSDLGYIGQSIRDADRWVVGGGYAHALRDGTLLFGSLYLVEENTQSSDPLAKQLGFGGWGLRFGGQTNLNSKTVLFANAGYEHRGYDAEDSNFEVVRGDNQTTISLGATYTVRRDLRVTGQYQYVDQNSNIPFNDYDRDIISVTVRKDF
jgi:tetratricopeptide (TPR) repeat protein